MCLERKEPRPTPRSLSVRSSKWLREQPDSRHVDVKAFARAVIERGGYEMIELEDGGWIYKEMVLEEEEEQSE